MAFDPSLISGLTSSHHHATSEPTTNHLAGPKAKRARLMPSHSGEAEDEPSSTSAALIARNVLGPEAMQAQAASASSGGASSALSPKDLELMTARSVFGAGCGSAQPRRELYLTTASSPLRGEEVFAFGPRAAAGGLEERLFSEERARKSEKKPADRPAITGAASAAVFASPSFGVEKTGKPARNSLTALDKEFLSGFRKSSAEAGSLPAEAFLLDGATAKAASPAVDRKRSAFSSLKSSSTASAAAALDDVSGDDLGLPYGLKLKMLPISLGAGGRPSRSSVEEESIAGAGAGSSSSLFLMDQMASLRRAPLSKKGAAASPLRNLAGGEGEGEEDLLAGKMPLAGPSLEASAASLGSAAFAAPAGFDYALGIYPGRIKQSVAAAPKSVVKRRDGALLSPMNKTIMSILENGKIKNQTGEDFRIVAIAGAAGQHSQVYNLVGATQFIPGIDNNDLIVKIFQEDVIHASGSGTTRFLETSLRQYNELRVAGQPIVRFYNADTAPSDGFLIVEKVIPFRMPWDASTSLEDLRAHHRARLAELRAFFDFAKTHNSKIPMDLNHGNFGVNVAGQLVLLDFMEHEEDDWEVKAPGDAFKFIKANCLKSVSKDNLIVAAYLDGGDL
jgi:hypothetical protein